MTNTQTKNYTDITVTKQDNSLVEITGEITADYMESFRAAALKKFSDKAEIPGFRKGNAPEDVVLQKIGEGTLLQEMAEMALQGVYPSLMEAEKVDAIGQPEITITKIAPQNPLGFKISTAVMPKVELPEYAKIAKAAFSKKDEPIVVEDKEVEDAIEHIRKMSVGEVTEESKKQEPPELNDEYVKKLGDFKDVADFKIKLRESIVKDKEMRAKEQKRVDVVEALLVETKTTLPSILIDSEVQKMFAQFKERLAQGKMKLEDYLKQSKKTEEEIVTEMRPEAEKRTKLNLMLHHIAMKEKLSPDPEKMKKEVAHILEHHKDADKTQVELYVHNVLTNETVFEFLEGKK